MSGCRCWLRPRHPHKIRLCGAQCDASKVPVTIAGIYGIFGSQVQRDKVDHPKFIDLFCGIGGMRLAFESAGAECVFSSDWDKYAQQTYAANFGDIPAGNIREIKASDIPDHPGWGLSLPPSRYPAFLRKIVWGASTDSRTTRSSAEHRDIVAAR